MDRSLLVTIEGAFEWQAHGIARCVGAVIVDHEVLFDPVHLADSAVGYFVEIVRVPPFLCKIKD